MKALGTVILACLMAASVWAKEGVDWKRDYEDALKQAKSEKKLVMVDVYTDWCGWCKKLDKDTYSDKDVQAKLSKDFVAVKVNPEKTVSAAKVEKQFGKTGYPHIVFVDADGKKLSDIRGYLPADSFLKALEQVTRKASK